MSKSQSTPPKSDILVVDDTPTNLRLLSGMLSEQGYKVRVIPNGVLALEAVQAAPPDLILLDINMPGLNGYQVCQQLKANKETCDIPIIFISALDEVLDKVKAFAVGGVDYITKPFQLEEVLARIKNHLALQNLQKQLQKTNDELLTTNMALQESNKELDAFAHSVAHDLKNPSAITISYADYLIRYISTIKQEELVEFLHIIKETGEKMANIVDELLLLSSVRKEEIKTQPIDMMKIVDTAQKRLAIMINEYQAELISPSTWPQAYGYAAWIEEVWVNYISNALKYGGTPPYIQFGSTIQNDGMIRFWLTDNGPGLTDEAQARLFTAFTRIDTIRAQGHGLGLSIVQRIITKLNGTVGVESKIGQGSTFYFTLPVVKS